MLLFCHKKVPNMEIETNTIEDCITIPLGGSKEVIQIFFDELEDDPSKLISVLIDESASLECWIQAAVQLVSKESFVGRLLPNEEI